MKRLILLRHAQTENHTANDKSRNLTQLGIEQSLQVGDILKDKQILPDYILCSSAERTKQTLQYIITKFDIFTENKYISYMDELYNISLEKMIDIISDIDKKINIMMIVNHNPTISILANLLVSNDKIKDGFNPASLACIKIHSNEWYDLRHKNCELEWFIK